MFKLLGIILLMALVVVAGTYAFRYYDQELEDNSYTFCQECCWKNSFAGTTYYTCADTKEKLWMKVR